jgi:hypothetical protein
MSIEWPSSAEVMDALYGKSRRKKGPEHLIQDSILEWLNLLPHVHAWRRNVGAVKATHNGKTRYVKFSEPGQSDVWGIGPHGVHIEIECKAPGKHPTMAQMYWLDAIKSAGGIAFWTDSLEACMDQLRFEYEKRGWKF